MFFIVTFILKNRLGNKKWKTARKVKIIKMKRKKNEEIRLFL